MRVFVSPKMLDGFTPVYDSAAAPKVVGDGTYMLVFETGRTTMKVFKQLYLCNRDAYFCVKNMEYFVQQLGPFRNIEIEVMEAHEHCVAGARAAAMEEQYAGVERAFRKTARGRSARARGKTRGGDGASTEEQIKRGIEISFAPRMFDSIRTCFREPAVYKSEPLDCHRLFCHLESKPRTYEDLETVLGKEVLGDTLKSMIFSGIVKQKDGCFYINDVLDG